jgi:EAL domain-containing protein (putative c-di-GMP-specific phosphodiesterase class I)
VQLEVTESVYMDDNDGMVAQAIEDLRADHLLVALDDFGTGFASLTHLLNFPVDIIKIDKSFVTQMSAGRGEVVIKALLDMADGLGMRVIAEGVENAITSSGVHFRSMLSVRPCCQPRANCRSARAAPSENVRLVDM